MDPVTHTLVGATFAQSGLKHRTALGTTTLLIGANFPDVDVISTFWGPETMVWFRRGVTHGVLALVVLPIVLAGLIMLWARIFRRSDVHVKQIWLLAFIAVASHPLLDFLNAYGMRWFMPFSERWTYGDTLFIADPVVWVVLAAGVYVAKRRERRLRASEDASHGPTASRPVVAPRTALLVVAAYVGIMAASNVWGRSIVKRTLHEQGIQTVRMMVQPLAVNPFVRRVVVQDPDVYRFGTLRFLPTPSYEPLALSLRNYPWHPAAAAAVRGPKPRQFMSWSRFPFYVLEERDSVTIVHIGDARYTIDPINSWASTSVRIGK